MDPERNALLQAALRDRELRTHPNAFLILVYLLPALSFDEPQVCKVGSMSLDLDMRRDRVRHAMRQLITLGYIVLAEVDTNQRKSYQLLRKKTNENTKGAHDAPPSSRQTLTQRDKAA